MFRPLDEGGYIFRGALNQGFHAAIDTVAHLAGDAELPRLVFHVVAEADALHAAGDDEMSGFHS